MKKIRLNLFVSTMIAAAITLGIASCGFRYPEMFCITLENKVGKRLEDVQIQVFDTNDNIVRTSITNESGECVFKLKSNDYKVKVSNLPDGYYVDKESNLKIALHFNYSEINIKKIKQKINKDIKELYK